MSAKVVGFAGMTIERAREIVVVSELYSSREIVTACKLLFEHGTADDARDVLALQKAGIVAGFERAHAPSLRVAARRERRVALLGIYVLFASAVGTVVLASWFFHAIKAVFP